ncbi:MAG TPA: PAS domain S-box protein [Longimicrobiaceae bacterium]
MEIELRRVIDALPGVVWTALPDGNVDFVNQFWCDHTGFSPERSRGRGWLAAFAPEDLTDLRERWRSILASGQAGEMKARLRRSDGWYRWSIVRARPLTGEAGRIVKWCGTIHEIEEDVTEDISVQRAQADVELRRSEARKTAILDSALDCIVTMDHEGRITEFNPAAERTFGFSREQVLGRPLAEVIIPPHQREAHWQGLARYLATEEPHVLGRRVEMTALRADGTEFPVELAITRIPLEGPPSFTGYLRDVTGRRQAEDELRRSEALLAEAQRLSLTGSFYWRVASDDVTLSEQTYRTYGFQPGEPVTLEMIGARTHPQDVRLLREMIAEARGPGSDLDYEYRLMLPDGTVKHLHLVARGSHGTNGELEYIGAVQDVTQRRLSEEALGQAQSELAHVTRATTLGALTASIAHEVNQPLSGILTNASTCLKMLASEPPNLEGARETARRTIRDGQRASEVVGRLRALFANKGTATEAIDLNDAAREVIALSSGEMQRGRVLLRTELAEDLPHVTGDRVQLQQVMLNLLRNALDAMSEVHDRPRELLIRTGREEGDRVRLSVRDAGEGLQAEGMDRLFDVFYTTKRGGMGVGLAVSRSIVESHRGRLWAEPNDGPGATFSFSIPALSAQTDARVGSPPGGTTA